MKYYAIAYNEETGRNVVIDNLSDVRHEAEQEAVHYCNKYELQYQGLYPVKGSGRQNSILTKTIDSKKGRKFYW